MLINPVPNFPVCSSCVLFDDIWVIKYYKYPSIVVYDNQFVAKKIAEKVREHISKEGAGEKRTPETQKIFNELTDWFECNPEVLMGIYNI